MAGEVERHLVVADDATGPSRHDDDPGGEEHGLLDAVGDEQPGELLVLEQAQQFVVQALAGDLVERTEGFVEQEHLRLQHQRAGQRAAHLHTARQLLGVLGLVADEVDQLDRCLGLGEASGLVHALQFGVQFDVALHGAPGQQRGVLEHIADARPVDLTGAAGVLLEARGDAQQGALPAAGGADDGDELAGTHIETDVVDSVCPVGEHHRQVLEPQGRCTGARRSTLRGLGNVCGCHHSP